jgi:methyltransferase (TIGR00027 family)
MIEGQPSQTAAFVATWRALGDYLPDDVRLCHDPLGWTFSPSFVARFRPLAERFPAVTGRMLLATPLKRLLLWIQLRTRAIDDIVRAFYRDGGRQIVILGAGYDSRATRMAAGLAGARFLEVDHPTTQARKRAILESVRIEANASFVGWDFERTAIEELPSKLKAEGLDADQPTLTIWEGVIPYLTEEAVGATLSAVRAFGGERSQVMLHYIERRRIESRTIWHVAASRFGEPLRFGWDPAALPEWLRSRGFELVSDRDDDALARELFTAGVASTFRFQGAGGRIAVATPRLSKDGRGP